MGKDSLITPGSMLDNALDAMYEAHRARESDPEGYARKESQIKLRPLLLDFYNLHVTSGPIYDHDLVFHESDFDYTIAPFEELNEEDLEVIFPDEQERKAIVTFISKSSPGSCMLNLNIEERQEEFFQSIHFLRFCEEYHHTRQLVDDHISGSGHIRDLQWLASRLGKGRQTIRARYTDKGNPHKDIDRSGDVLEWQYKKDESDRIRFSDYVLYRSWENIHTQNQTSYYGQALWNFFDNIHFALCQLLEERWEIGKCNLERCDNIFMIGGPGKPRKYCSETHRVRAYQLRKARVV